jgi:histidinol-phosphatase (PHP family)
MIANYHTHTWRCLHAVGTEEEYVQCALDAGLKILGFADHSPYIFPGEYYSTFRMRLHQLNDYVRTVLELRAKYMGQIRIPLGLELEYYPRLLPELLAVLRDYPMDYLLLGQHFLGNEYDGVYNGLMTYDEAPLKQYVKQTCDAMQTGLFTYFAHPDLIHYCGDREKYRTHMRQICREAKSCDIPLELNLLGLAGGRHYPDCTFWELAAEEGCQVILGRDAHEPQALLDEKTERLALELADTMGLQLIQRVDLRKIY